MALGELAVGLPIGVVELLGERLLLLGELLGLVLGGIPLAGGVFFGEYGTGFFLLGALA
jgi:hypothetical protein